MFQLAHTLFRSSTHFLWYESASRRSRLPHRRLAIVGSTSCFLHQQIDVPKYQQLVQQYHDLIEGDLLPGYASA